ncbi:MAG TPA: ATPase [Erysipelotrichaceae bacterium]|nr:ATPase [Erysipelotrichaceae bacterium]
MHIKKAKAQIKNAIIAYSTKDSRGRYRIPVSKQRPVFLVGAPGIGKTAIVEQIARELNIGFVSYAMTHHTRQSALGLPFIVEKEYGGELHSVSEYTMSEIIASVYDEISRSGKKQGILFLDEINCVSETLAPSMLQFLQYKTFGRHRVPEGWIVVTAGNPAEYNDSVREYDIAMLDRLKKIEVEPDYEVWKEYAVQNNVHPSVLSYLAIRTQYFYRVTTTVDGKSFVTARAWDDLSQMISLYEENEIEIDYDLISQYVQDEEIAKDFANYYDLYRKYRSDYQIPEILEGNVSSEIKERAENAKFDERLSLISLIISSLDEEITGITLHEDALQKVISEFKENRNAPAVFLKEMRIRWKSRSEKTDTKENADLAAEVFEIYEGLSKMQTEDFNMELLKNNIKNEVIVLKEESTLVQKHLDNVFRFFEECFGNGQEMLILVSELTIRPYISRYIYRHGCDKYYEYNKQLLFEDRQQALSDRIDALNLLELEQ